MHHEHLPGRVTLSLEWPESQLNSYGLGMAQGDIADSEGRGHMALGQWTDMGEPDRSGIAPGVWGACIEQNLDVYIIGKLV